jgi:Homeodomain-like domain
VTSRVGGENFCGGLPRRIGDIPYARRDRLGNQLLAGTPVKSGSHENRGKCFSLRRHVGELLSACRLKKQCFLNSLGVAIHKRAGLTNAAQEVPPYNISRVLRGSQERPTLEQLLRRGKAGTRKLTRARILLKADESLSDEEIAAALHVGTATVGRTRQRFVEENLGALDEHPPWGTSRGSHSMSGFGAHRNCRVPTRDSAPASLVTTGSPPHDPRVVCPTVGAHTRWSLLSRRFSPQR